MIKLGDLARDRVTGFTGIVMAKTDWLNNCTRITLQPRTLKDGTLIQTETFDDVQVEVIKPGAFFEKEPKTGGPQPSPTRARDPG